MVRPDAEPAWRVRWHRDARRAAALRGVDV